MPRFAPSPVAPEDQEDPYLSARLRMVVEQLEERGIRDPRVLEAMGRVRRHRFVPEASRGQAYEDHPLDIGERQTISQPYIVACMTEALSIDRRDRVLEVGTGSGYQAAVLAELAGQVFSVERLARLSEGAQRTLHALGYANVRFRTGDGSLGWPEEAPFDGILVTAAAPRLPRRLMEQLVDGGTIVVPVGSRRAQTLQALTRHGADWETKNLCTCLFVSLLGEEGWEN